MREHVAFNFLTNSIPSTMEQKKYELEMKVEKARRLASGMSHLVLRRADKETMPPMAPGQFVEVRVGKAKVLLNRPYSIYNRTENELELLVSPLGQASRILADYDTGDTLTVTGPLGHGFSLPLQGTVALMGGGVGIAPLYYQARALKEAGTPFITFYGSRTAPDAEIVERFAALAPVHVCTDDGSAGFHGLITAHPALNDNTIGHIQICGPKPMMVASARVARQKGIDAEVSLENMMACGLGACLCCVEQTVAGNKCVCTTGPVFNISELTWK